MNDVHTFSPEEILAWIDGANQACIESGMSGTDIQISERMFNRFLALGVIDSYGFVIGRNYLKCRISLGEKS
jgi:hypothetical protein